MLNLKRNFLSMAALCFTEKSESCVIRKNSVCLHRDSEAILSKKNKLLEISYEIVRSHPSYVIAGSTEAVAVPSLPSNHQGR